MSWAIFASICSSNLGPLTQAEELLPKEHSMQKTLDIVSNKLSSGGASSINIIMYWGAKDIDKEGVS
jgi:hypothetical protein